MNAFRQGEGGDAAWQHATILRKNSLAYIAFSSPHLDGRKERQGEERGAMSCQGEEEGLQEGG